MEERWPWTLAEQLLWFEWEMSSRDSCIERITPQLVGLFGKTMGESLEVGFLNLMFFLIY